MCRAVCVLFCVAVIGVFGADESIEDVVRVLQKQMTTLLTRRQEDLKLLESSLRHSLEKNFELSDLRSEVQKLRRERRSSTYREAR
ncbi:unnamed protein product [Bemisia tabaci]|uniref:Uncharacterized protein n=1 Tax=Bemisia tabaci TaxID=7038 RepID=A0A9P0A847_BEMTA|nr:unnamed protein product [Bemisia tabaci]